MGAKKSHKKSLGKKKPATSKAAGSILSRSKARVGGQSPALGAWSTAALSPPTTGLWEFIVHHGLSGTESQNIIVEVSKVSSGNSRIVKGILLVGNEKVTDDEKGAKISIHLCTNQKVCDGTHATWHASKWRSVSPEEIRKGTHWARSLVSRLSRAADLRNVYKQANPTVNAGGAGGTGKMDATAFAETGNADGRAEVEEGVETSLEASVRLCDMAQLWTRTDWENAGKFRPDMVRQLMVNPDIQPAMLQRCVDALTGGEAQPRVDPTAHLAELLAGLLAKKRKTSRGAGVGLESDSESDGGDVKRRPSGREGIMREWKSKPGSLAKSCLGEIVELMGTEVPSSVPTSKMDITAMPPLFRTHVARSDSIRTATIRNRREIQTIALCLDLLVQRQTHSAMDVLVQRLKAVELSIIDGDWMRAEMLELIPPPGGGLASKEELVKVSRELTTENKYGMRGRSAPPRRTVPHETKKE